jgi:sulfide dehydrogenase cytochrome subunit
MLTKKLVSAVIFTLLLVAGYAQAGGDAARGEELSIDCADCHGPDGKGDEFTPGIAGLDEAYHVEQLKAFKSGERTDEDEMMLMYTEELSEQDMKDLAAYYATLPGD